MNHHLAFRVLLGFGLACTSNDVAMPSKGAPGEEADEVSGSSSPTNAADDQSQFGTEASEAASTGNIVDSGGRVLINVGPLHDLRSTDPIRHIRQKEVPGVASERIYLAATATDSKLGVTFKFEVDYVEGSDPIELVKHGYLSLIDKGPMRLAAAGHVTVSKQSDGRWKLAFTGLRLGEETAPGTLGSLEDVPDGTIVGEVVRVCGNGVDADPSDPFCAHQ